jgi:hypothetical protein
VASGWQQPSQATARFSIYVFSTRNLSIYLYLSIYLSIPRTLGANGLHIHQLVPQSRAQCRWESSARRGPERRAWTQTPRCLAAPPFGPPDELRGDGRRRRREEAAEEQAAAAEEELLLGFI